MSQSAQQQLAAAGHQSLVLCEEEERGGSILVLCIRFNREVEGRPNNPVHWLRKSLLTGTVEDSPRSNGIVHLSLRELSKTISPAVVLCSFLQFLLAQLTAPIPPSHLSPALAGCIFIIK